jgi:hypothetical protein
MHFHRRFRVTRLWKKKFHRHPAQAVHQSACRKGWVDGVVGDMNLVQDEDVAMTL